MQMHIRHETRYRYERPVKYSVQSLHLTPRRDLSQRALAWNIVAPGRRPRADRCPWQYFAPAHHRGAAYEKSASFVHGVVGNRGQRNASRRRALVAAGVSRADAIDTT